MATENHFWCKRMTGKKVSILFQTAFESVNKFDVTRRWADSPFICNEIEDRTDLCDVLQMKSSYTNSIGSSRNLMMEIKNVILMK